MGQEEATRQSDWILPMMVTAAGVPNGIAVACTTTPAPVDLTSVTGYPDTWDGGYPTHAADNPNPLGKYVDIEAQGGDVFVIAGPTLASVTGANVPNAATTNTINGSGVVTMAKGVCVHIPQGTTKSFKLPEGTQGTGNGPRGQNSPCRFLSFVTASGTATARLWMSSVK